MGSSVTTNHIGETSIAKNGQKMTLIAWNAYSSVDIQFEDGTIVEHTQYQHFKNGYVKNPTYKMEV